MGCHSGGLWWLTKTLLNNVFGVVARCAPNTPITNAVLADSVTLAVRVSTKEV